MILAGDIGGTKTVLALFEVSGDSLTKVREEVYPSQASPTFDRILDEFFREGRVADLTSGCFGVAGAIVDGHSHTTNLPWHLYEGALAEKLKVRRVKLLNDLEAAAYGMLFLKPEESYLLQPGNAGARKGNVGIIAAGTGLGEAMLYWDGEHYQPIASEGGHSDFAPHTPMEIELLSYLTEKFGGHVSWERVLSGPAFHNIYNFLRDSGHQAEAPEVAEQLAAGDANATISKLGLAGTDPLCVATMELFCSIYGSEAGNVAIRSVATGGVFLAGGIAPKILPALSKSEFVPRFLAKGRMREFLEGVEIRVALNPRAPLIGAAHYGIRL